MGHQENMDLFLVHGRGASGEFRDKKHDRRKIYI